MSQSNTHRLSFSLLFPEGISLGESRGSNIITVARDGQSRPILRGSALCGALRHAYAQRKQCDPNDDLVSQWFGSALDASLFSSPSRLCVPDTILETGLSNATLRTHIAVERHRGAVREHGLYSIEALPPGTQARLVFWVEESTDAGNEVAEDSDARTFLKEIAAILNEGLILGGRGARGLGRTVIDGPIHYRGFELRNLSDHADFLDEKYQWLRGDNLLTGEVLVLDASPAADTLRLRVRLMIPPAQDALVADGTALDVAAEPQQTLRADGALHWKIPGSTFRGIFRSWFTRLAARSGHRISDSLERHQSGQAATGEDIAWDFSGAKERDEKIRVLEKSPEKLDEIVSCPVLNLFGSGYARGRIHISDALSCVAVKPSDAQKRAHVAVDRITGGAREGALFMNRVLVAGQSFEMSITIRNPKRIEAQWINSALMAMHHGILRIGSSKASGWFQLAEPATADGPFSEAITTFKNEKEEQ